MSEPIDPREVHASNVRFICDRLDRLLTDLDIEVAAVMAAYGSSDETGTEPIYDVFAAAYLRTGIRQLSDQLREAVET